MKPADMKTLQARLGFEHQGDFANALGISRDALRDYLTGKAPIKPVLALACAALAAGLPPYSGATPVPKAPPAPAPEPRTHDLFVKVKGKNVRVGEITL